MTTPTGARTARALSGLRPLRQPAANRREPSPRRGRPIGMRSRLLPMIAAFVLGAVTACGAPEASPPQAPAPASERPSAISRTPLPTLSPPPRVQKTPADGIQPVTVRGTVRITGQCVELVTDSVIWVLVGTVAASLRHGEVVGVTGLPAPQMELPCDGSPLSVNAVKR